MGSELVQQFPLWGKSQVVAAISQSRRALYAEKQTRFGNRGYKTGIAGTCKEEHIRVLAH